MSPDQINNRIQMLQQQLLMLGNNPVGYQQTMAEIQQLQNMLRSMGNMGTMSMNNTGMNNTNMYNSAMNTQQNDMMYRQQMEQEMQQRALQEQMRMRQMQNMSMNGGAQGANMGNWGSNGYVVNTMQDNNNYDRRGIGSNADDEKYLDMVDTVSPTQEVSNVTSVEPTIVRKPLKGSEFPLLVDDGIEVIVGEVGEYFQYIVQGEGKMKSIDVKVLGANPVIGKDSDLLMLAVKNKVNTYVTDGTLSEEIPVVCNQKIDGHVIANILSADNGDVVAIGKKLSEAMGDEDNYTLYKVLDGMLTRLVNDILKCVIGSDISIDSFIDDIEELAYDYIPKLQDTEFKTQWGISIDKLSKSLVSSSNLITKNNSKELKGDTDVVKYEASVTYIYSSSFYIRKDMKAILKDTTMHVSFTSHPALHDLLTKAYDGTHNFKLNGYAYLYVNNKASSTTISGDRYLIYKMTNGGFNITAK